MQHNIHSLEDLSQHQSKTQHKKAHGPNIALHTYYIPTYKTMLHTNVH